MWLPSKKVLFPFYGKNWRKMRSELDFWRQELRNYVAWYKGEIETHYGETCPGESDRIFDFKPEINAILTWTRVHQQGKYLEDLKLEMDAFAGERILDIGSGPLASAAVFSDCELYCLDPLLPLYILAGFPIHCYPSHVRFMYGSAENIPAANGFFDAAISVNALDHVDDLEMASEEIRRVRKKHGRLRFHLHYHRKTKTEPLELNDETVARAFDWCKDFRKIHQSSQKRGHVLTDAHEQYAVWSNF